MPDLTIEEDDLVVYSEEEIEDPMPFEIKQMIEQICDEANYSDEMKQMILDDYRKLKCLLCKQHFHSVDNCPHWDEFLQQNQKDGLSKEQYVLLMKSEQAKINKQTKRIKLGKKKK